MIRTLTALAVTLASGAHDALILLADRRRFDVILRDLMMSPTTGMELFEAVEARGLAKESAWLFMTGGTTAERARRFAEAHRDVVLEKPLSVRALFEAVRRSIQPLE